MMTGMATITRIERTTDRSGRRWIKTVYQPKPKPPKRISLRRADWARTVRAALSLRPTP